MLLPPADSISKPLCAAERVSILSYGDQRLWKTDSGFRVASPNQKSPHLPVIERPAGGSEADKKAFKRLQAELQAILPLPGDPFRKEGAQFHPLFELTLPNEHWRDLSEENELGSEED